MIDFPYKTFEADCTRRIMVITILFLHESYRSTIGFDGIDAGSQCTHVNLTFVTFLLHHTARHVEYADIYTLRDIQIKEVNHGIGPECDA